MGNATKFVLACLIYLDTLSFSILVPYNFTFDIFFGLLLNIFVPNDQYKSKKLSTWSCRKITVQDKIAV
jgi:hypothetical protein